MSDESNIFAAVKAGDFRAVTDLLAANPHLARAKNQYGWTVLFEAVASGHAEIVRVLVANGAKLSVRYGEGRTLLHQAVKYPNNPEVVQYLLQQQWHRLDPNAVDKEFGGTPLHVAVDRGYQGGPPLRWQKQVVELLLAHGADPNLYEEPSPTYLTKTLHTPLHMAVANNTSKEIIELLIAYGANLAARTKTFFSDKTRGGGCTALHIAAMEGYLEIAEVFITRGTHVNARDANYSTPLHYAVSSGQREVATLLLARGADVDAQNYRGETSLHLLAAFSTPKNTELAELLVSHKATLNLYDSDGSAPLHVAAREGNSDMIKFLLRRGADPKQGDKYGRTAMQLAVRGGHEDLAKVLAI